MFWEEEAEAAFFNTTPLQYQPLPGLVTDEQYLIFLQASMVIRTVACWIGIYTNAVNIRAFYRMGLADSLTIVFFGLAITDFLHLSSAFMLVLVSLMEVLHSKCQLQLPIHPYYILYFASAFVRIFTEVINLTTTFLAVQRCLCVAMPLQFKSIFTRRRVVIVLAVIWIFVLVSLVTLMFQNRLEKIHDPSLNASLYVLVPEPTREIINNIMYILFGLVLNIGNLITILICVIIMSRALTKSLRFRQKSSTSGVRQSSGPEKNELGLHHEGKKKLSANVSNSKEKQTIIQVTLVSTIYLCCNLPRLAGTLAKVIEPRLNMYSQFSNLTSVLYVSITTMDIFNSSVNFFVYYTYNSKFRSVCFRPKEVKL